MKYIKTYEMLNNLPKVGDYVISNINFNINIPSNVKELMEFVNNNIGQIIEINVYNKYLTKYNIPESIININKVDSFLSEKVQIFHLNIESILFWSSDKEIAELYLKNMKYNI